MINSGKEWDFMDSTEFTEKRISNLLVAWDYASKHHKGQMYGSKPYMVHLKNVSDVALDLNYTDEKILIGCLLHDIVEDTKVNFEDLKSRFGQEVAEIVYCVTDELGRNRKERKSKTYKKIRNNPNAIVVKLCDRISNITESMGKNNYNLKLMKMYLDEHIDFVKGISNHDSLDITTKSWDKYYSVKQELENKFKDIDKKLSKTNIL